MVHKQLHFHPHFQKEEQLIFQTTTHQCNISNDIDSSINNVPNSNFIDKMMKIYNKEPANRMNVKY